MTVYDFKSTNRAPLNPPAAASGLGGVSPHARRASESAPQSAAAGRLGAQCGELLCHASGV